MGLFEKIDIIEAVTALFGVLAWFIRLEAKVMYLEKDHEAHKKLQNEKMDAAWTKFDSFQGLLTQVLQSVARIEGKLSDKD